MGPVRTCVGCGERAGRRELVRLRIEGERVVIDRDRKGGRGAWLHAARSCLDQAVRRRALARAFRGKTASIDAPALLVELTGNARKD
jgi:predicted RNA-binding protein YlxR (DUF448 family)